MELPHRTGPGKLISIVVVVVGLLAGIVQILDFFLRQKPAEISVSSLPPAPQIPTPTPAPIPDLSPTPVPDQSEIVYRTASGERYHRANCRHVKGKAIELTLTEAQEIGLTPCRGCRPPAI